MGRRGGKEQKQLDLRWDDGLNQPVFAKVEPISFQVQMVVQAQNQNTSHRSLGSSSDNLVTVPGLYAVGPVRGDNFVRLLQGDAFAVLRNLLAIDRGSTSTQTRTS